MARVKIKELRLRNFRAFENARFVLDDKLTVVIGRNGSGKSTLMEAFDFIRDALSDSLVNALERRGGLIGIRRRRAGNPTPYGASYDLSLSVVLEVDGREALYGFRLNSRITGVVIKEEMLTTGEGGWFKRTAKKFETNVAGIAPSLLEQSLLLPLISSQDNLWELVIDALRRVRTYNIVPVVLKGEPKIGSGMWLERDGSNAGDVLRQLQVSAQVSAQASEEKVKHGGRQNGSIRWITDYLSLITPGVVEVRAEASSDARRRIVFEQQSREDDKEASIFAAAEMSDGTLRALGILLALRQEPTPAMVFFDEIEDSIHPSVLGVILEAIEASTERMQIVITSHSTDLLERDIISAEEVRVVEWQNGISSIHQLGENIIKAVDGPYEDVLQPDQTPYTVGELLRYNALFTEDEPAAVKGDFFEVVR